MVPSIAGKILINYVEIINSYFLAKNGNTNASAYTSIRMSNSNDCVKVPKLVVIADGSGSMAYENWSIGRMIPNQYKRGRLINFINNCKELFPYCHRIWFFGEKASLDTRSPKDGIPTLELIQNMQNLDFFISSTHTDAIGPVFSGLCQSEDSDPTVLLIMTDGTINEPSTFSRLVRDSVKQIPEGKRCGLVHIVLWILV